MSHLNYRSSAERKTTLRVKQLPVEIIAGFEKIGLAHEVPVGKLQEIIRLRAIIRDLVAHINWLEDLIEQDAAIA